MDLVETMLSRAAQGLHDSWDEDARVPVEHVEGITMRHETWSTANASEGTFTRATALVEMFAALPEEGRPELIGRVLRAAGLDDELHPVVA